MAGNQSYQVQLEALVALEASLRQVDEQTQVVIGSYIGKISDAYNRGLSDKDYVKMRDVYYPESARLLNSSSAIIQNEVIPYIRLQIQDLNQLLNR